MSEDGGTSFLAFRATWVPFSWNLNMFGFCEVFIFLVSGLADWFDSFRIAEVGIVGYGVFRVISWYS